MPNRWRHWTDLNQTYDCYFKKIVQTSPGVYPHGLGAKNAYLDRLWSSTEHISATEHDINNWNENYQSTGTPLHAPKFGEL